MKKIKYISIIILLVVINSCNKETPTPDKSVSIGCVGASWYTNKYILTDINTYNYKKDTIWQKAKDTVIYNNFYIKVDYNGLLISENTYYGETANIPSLIEQKYFINKIKDYKIYANNININSKVQFFKKNKEGIYSILNIIGDELGYTPLRVELLDTLNKEEAILFKVIITDDNNNVFISQTDSVFILNK